MRALGILVVAFAVGCGVSDSMPGTPLGVLVDPGSEFSAIRYADRDLVSVNDRCPVRGEPLRTVVEPIYVNGRPIGFC